MKKIDKIYIVNKSIGRYDTQPVFATTNDQVYELKESLNLNKYKEKFKDIYEEYFDQRLCEKDGEYYLDENGAHIFVEEIALEDFCVKEGM